MPLIHSKQAEVSCGMTCILLHISYTKSFSLITLLICTDAQISQQTSEILVSIANLETSTPYPHRGRGKSKAILLALILIAASAAASTTLCLSERCLNSPPICH